MIGAGQWQSPVVDALADLSDVDTSGVTDGQVLAYDSGSSLWVPETVSGGGTAGVTKIAETTLASAAASVTFSSIPGTYRALLILGRTRTTRAGSAGDTIRVRVGNGSADTGNNYSYSFWYNSTGTTTSEQADSTSAGQVAGSVGATGTAGYFSAFELLIYDYANTAANRQMLGRGGGYRAAGNVLHGVAACMWKNTAAAIDTVELASFNGANLDTGTKFTLYGLTA